jgi:hypothetical protein
VKAGGGARTSHHEALERIRIDSDVPGQYLPTIRADLLEFPDRRTLLAPFIDPICQSRERAHWKASADLIRMRRTSQPTLIRIKLAVREGAH